MPNRGNPSLGEIFKAFLADKRVAFQIQKNVAVIIRRLRKARQAEIRHEVEQLEFIYSCSEGLPLGFGPVPESAHRNGALRHDEGLARPACAGCAPPGL
jgi:hypothetical protein